VSESSPTTGDEGQRVEGGEVCGRERVVREPAAPTPLLSRTSSRRSSRHPADEDARDYGGLRAAADEIEHFLDLATSMRAPVFARRAARAQPQASDDASPIVINVRTGELPEAIASEGDTSSEDGAVRPRAAQFAQRFENAAHDLDEVPGSSDDHTMDESEEVATPLFDRPTRLVQTLRDVDAGDDEVDAAALRDVQSFGLDDADSQGQGWSAFGDLADEMRLEAMRRRGGYAAQPRSVLIPAQKQKTSFGRTVSVLIPRVAAAAAATDVLHRSLSMSTVPFGVRRRAAGRSDEPDQPPRSPGPVTSRALPRRRAQSVVFVSEPMHARSLASHRPAPLELDPLDIQDEPPRESAAVSIDSDGFYTPRSDVDGGHPNDPFD
jgi:hypothetical protein